MAHPVNVDFQCRPGDTVHVIDAYIVEGHIKYIIFKDTVECACISITDPSVYYDTTNCSGLTWMESIFPDRSSAIEYATLNKLDFQEAD